LSSDYRFGDGDLGPRGMALFFHNFRHSAISDSLGMPIFHLSRNEIRHQAKYDDDEETLSDEELSHEGVTCSFQRLDANRMRRRSMLLSPKDILPMQSQDTLRRSNVVCSRSDIRKSFRQSLKLPKPPKLSRSSSDVDEVAVCLERAKKDLEFSHRDFHRKATGEVRERQYKGNSTTHRISLIARKVSAPIVIADETKKNLGKVHYQLAVLHGSGRFPTIVPEQPGEHEHPDHDAFSVIFHLSYAAALNNAPACLALARLQASLDSYVSSLLKQIVPTDFESAKDLLRRAMDSPHPPASPKAAAGCLLYQILQDEAQVLGNSSRASDKLMIHVVQDTIQLLEQAEEESSEAKKHKEKAITTKSFSFKKNDRVEADYELGGSYYSANVEDVSEDGERITVRYDDDGSSETLLKQHVRLLVPPTATQTTSGGPLSDEEAFGEGGGDDTFLGLEAYELQAELAELSERVGELAEASALYEQAADAAMIAGKMKAATEWSLKASELLQ
jgi:elongation factor 2 kinase